MDSKEQTPLKEKLEDLEFSLKEVLVRLQKFNAESQARQKQWKKKDH